MWNYRVVRRKHVFQDPDTDQQRVTYSYGIHEAYYDQSGHVGMITQHAEEPYGENIEELRHNWVRMAAAFGLPILEYDNIPEPGYDNTFEDSANGPDAQNLLEDESGNDDWDIEMTPEELSEYYRELESKRILCEQQHTQQFIGMHPLKLLIETMYDDYMAWCERNRDKD